MSAEPATTMVDASRRKFELILQRCMKAELRRITSKGIRWDGREYVAPEIMTNQGGDDVRIRVLKRVHDRIWVYDEHDQFICVAFCLDEMAEEKRDTYRKHVVNTREARLRAAQELVDNVIQLRNAQRPETQPKSPPAERKETRQEPDDGWDIEPMERAQ